MLLNADVSNEQPFQAGAILPEAGGGVAGRSAARLRTWGRQGAGDPGPNFPIITKLVMAALIECAHCKPRVQPGPFCSQCGARRPGSGIGQVPPAVPADLPEGTVVPTDPPAGYGRGSSVLIAQSYPTETVAFQSYKKQTSTKSGNGKTVLPVVTAESPPEAVARTPIPVEAALIPLQQATNRALGSIGACHEGAAIVTIGVTATGPADGQPPMNFALVSSTGPEAPDPPEKFRNLAARRHLYTANGKFDKEYGASATGKRPARTLSADQKDQTQRCLPKHYPRQENGEPCFPAGSTYRVDGFAHVGLPGFAGSGKPVHIRPTPDDCQPQAVLDPGLILMESHPSYPEFGIQVTGRGGSNDNLSRDMFVAATYGLGKIMSTIQTAQCEPGQDVAAEHPTLWTGDPTSPAWLKRGAMHHAAVARIGAQVGLHLHLSPCTCLSALAPLHSSPSLVSLHLFPYTCPPALVPLHCLLTLVSLPSRESVRRWGCTCLRLLERPQCRLYQALG